MAATTSFHEVVCKGSPDPVRGLITGLALGADLDHLFWFHDEADFVDPTITRKIRRRVERLHLLPVTEVRLVVGGELAKLLRSRRKAIGESGVCEIVDIRRVKQARVQLDYHTYARRYDDEVQILLRDLPRGVKLVNHERDVDVDPEAGGVEAYAATHEFESRGCGVLQGRFDLVIDLRDRLDVHPLIDFAPIELVTA